MIIAVVIYLFVGHVLFFMFLIEQSKRRFNLTGLQVLTSYIICVLFWIIIILAITLNTLFIEKEDD
jgi:hypothetical protein